MFCSKCGAQVPEGSAFCTMCGNKIEPVNQQINEQGAQPGYGAPATPQQPVFEPAQPQQPMYEQPSQQSYEGPAAPQQPVFESAQPQYPQAPPQYPQGGAPQPLPPKKSNKGLVIGIIAGVVAVVVIVVAVLFGTGTIGGKDSGDSEDNKTTSSQQESGDSNDDSTTTAPAQTVAQNVKVTLSNGLSFGIGDKAEVFDNLSNLTVDIWSADNDIIESLDDTLAAGKTCTIDFNSETFDYSTIEVEVYVKNNTSSDVKIREAEIVAVTVEKESESRAEDETAIDVMGLKANATKEQVQAKFDELKYTKKDTLNADEYDDEKLAATVVGLTAGEYYILDNGDNDFICIAKNADDNYIVFWIEGSEGSEKFSEMGLYTEDTLLNDFLS